MSPPPAVRLELLEISKRFPGTVANDRISLKVHKGEIHALLGENGAGKSTLMNLIYGVLKPDNGQIIWQNKEVRIDSPEHARELGIGMVFQHFSLFETLTVRENLLLALPAKQYTVYKDGLLDRRIAELSITLDTHIDLDRPVAALSVGEKQRVEILRCLLQDVKLLILDEPTSVLTPQETKALIKTLKQLATDGCSILFISHKIDEVRSLCDKATVLRAGRVSGQFDPAETSTDQITAMILGNEIELTSEFDHKTPQKPLFSLHNVSTPEHAGAYRGERVLRIRSINLELGAGSILGLAGVSGNGQEALLDIISGEASAVEGDIQFKGQSLVNQSVVERRRKGISVLPADRLGRSAIASLSLTKNYLLTRLSSTSARVDSGKPVPDKLLDYGLIHWRTAREQTDQAIKTYAVKARSADADAGSLSGGNLQKFLVGRELSANPELLVLYNPTWGVDVGSANRIHQSLIQLRDKGAAILVISEDLDELFLISDQLAAICDGHLSQVLPKTEVSRDLLGHWMTGTNLTDAVTTQGTARPESTSTEVRA